MMTRGRRVHGLRAAVALSILLLILGTVHAVRSQQLVGQIVSADLGNIATRIEKLDYYRPLANRALRLAASEFGNETPQKLNASLALLPVDPEQAWYLADRLHTAAPQETSVIRDALVANDIPEEVTNVLWSRLTSQSAAKKDEVLPAASTLALLRPDDAYWQQHGSNVAEALVQTSPVYLGSWMELLRPVRTRLNPSLAKIYQDHSESRSNSQRELATTILADYAADQPRLMTELLITGDALQFKTMFVPASRPDNKRIVIDLCRQELKLALHPNWKDPPLNAQWKDPGLDIQAVIEKAQGMLAERFAFCQAMPWEQFLVVEEALTSSGYWPTRIRPWLSGDQRLVAAVWTRDGQRRAIADRSDQEAAPHIRFPRRGRWPIACGHRRVAVN